MDSYKKTKNDKIKIAIITGIFSLLVGVISTIGVIFSAKQPNVINVNLNSDELSTNQNDTSEEAKIINNLYTSTPVIIITSSTPNESTISESKISNGGRMAINAYITNNVGLKNISYELYDVSNGNEKLIDSDDKKTSNPTLGSSAIGIFVNIKKPSELSKIKIVVTATSMDGIVGSDAFEYYIRK